MQENYLMNYDVQTGEIKGFYLRSIHENIPKPVIEVTPEKHDFYMQNNGKYRLNPITLIDEEIPTSESYIVPTIENRISSVEDALTMLMGV